MGLHLVGEDPPFNGKSVYIIGTHQKERIEVAREFPARKRRIYQSFPNAGEVIVLLSAV